MSMSPLTNWDFMDYCFPIFPCRAFSLSELETQIFIAHSERIAFE